MSPYLENFTDESGVNHPQAFIAIDSVNVDWKARTAVFVLGVYKDGTARMEGKRAVDTRVAVLSSEPDQAGKTFDDFLSLTVLANPTFNPIQAIELHLSNLPILQNAALIQL